MEQNIISNPSIPYLGPLNKPYRQLSPGFTVHIRGTAHPNCNRFGINLQCGPNISPRDDVLLHVGVDFIRRCVIRNTIQQMQWGPEETEQNHFPFEKGAPFDIAIRCEPSHFVIIINNQHFASFEHRIVYHRATHLAIDGDIFVSSIQYSLGSSPGSIPYPGDPTLGPHVTNVYPTSPFCPYPVTNPSVPLSTTTPYPTPGFGQVPPTMPMTGAPYPQQPMPAGYPQSYPAPPLNAHSHGHGSGNGKGIGGFMQKLGIGGTAATIGGATAATAGLGYLGGKKAWKKQNKARKKALKYGLPLAGAGLGAYAISKAWSSSSSSSSSDEE